MLPNLFLWATAEEHKHAADTEGRASLLRAVMLIQATLKFTLSYVLYVIHAYKSRRNYHNNQPSQNRTYSPKENFACLDDTPAYSLFHWLCSFSITEIKKKSLSLAICHFQALDLAICLLDGRFCPSTQIWASHSLTFLLSSKSSHYRAKFVILSSLPLLSLIFSKWTKSLLNFGRQNWKHHYSSARSSTQKLW